MNKKEKVFNYVEGISIRQVHMKDFYDGIILQSSGDVNDLFELSYKDDNWFYKAVYNIPQRGGYNYNTDTFNTKDDIGEYFLNKLEVGNTYRLDDNDTIDWYQTLYTQQVDKVVIRENKLKELLV